jgi:hypothetical protein
MTELNICLTEAPVKKKLIGVFILRGMNPGISYLSPKLTTQSEVTSEIWCH